MLKKLEQLGRRRENRAVRVAVRAARSLIRGYDGPSAVLRDMEHNGEKRVVDQLGSELGVVFDVGANVGDWTQNALRAGAGHVHAFEISPTTSAGLTQRYAAEPRVTVNAFGLSSAAGTVTIHHYPEHPALTTITDYPHDAKSTAIDVPVRTGDDYVAEAGVDRIDFMKLDVEGAEEAVIAGFRETFARGAVRVVQFEYGRVSILTKYLLRDFYADLTGHGFTIGMIEPNGVLFADYDMSMEKFNDSNWLAVHKSCAELIARVAQVLARLDPDDARRFGHVPGLDGLRAVAVLLVIGFHFGALWGKDGGVLPGGFLGVDIFFVLSGFLITSLLVSEQAKAGTVNLTRFYARRALRLFPALAFMAAADVAYTLWIGASLTQEAKELVSVVLYVSNFAQTYFLPEMLKSSLTFTWSLAIEEQFYLLWPALLLFGVLRYARTRSTVLVVIAGGALASALLRVVVWNWGSGHPAAYMRPDCRADGLLIGALCAFAWRWGLVPRRFLNTAALVCAAALLLTAAVATLDSAMYNVGFTLASLATGVIILAIAENQTVLVPLLEWSPLRTIGKVSYGLYLWHPLGLGVALHAFEDSGRATLLVVGLAVMALGVTVSWVFVEQPFLRLKTRVASPVSH